MTVYYEYFYRKNGIRIPAQLMSPPLSLIENLELPRQSIFHHTSISPVEVGPAIDEYLFRTITRPIMMDHVTENGDDKGNPRRLAISADTIIRTYHLKHRRYRIMHSLAASTRDPNTMVVINYSVIPRMYKYMRSFYSEYYKWWNINAAVWKKIADLANETDRQQFLLCRLPTILPSVPDLRLATGPMTQKLVRKFNNADSLMILEIWKWLSENRKDSLISKVPEDKLNKINLIFQESGRWFVLNLGKLNSWRTATKEELEINAEANTKGIEPQMIQRRFLRLMMSLLQVRTVGDNSVKDQPVNEIDTGDKTSDNAAPVVVSQDAVLPKTDEEGNQSVSVPEVTDLPEEAKTSNVDVKDDDNEIYHDEDIDARLNDELAELERISELHHNTDKESDELNFDQAEEEPDQVLEVAIKEPLTLEQGVMSVCDRLADAGMLSAAEYRRYQKLSEKYKTIVAPNGKETLDGFIKIPQEKLAIKESHAVKDIKTVVDKTMLKSSLHDFDTKYIKDIMHRDIAGMVMHVQHAGIAVTDYDVEVNDEIMGSFEMHTVRVTPVEGQSSTFRFKLPHLEEDGTFRANGVVYRLRKQRSDLPIRKVAPDRVALTSYYGKIFADRSTKKVNDYGQWIRNNIMAKGLDVTDNTITDLQPTNVFDNEFKAPRIYSIIATGFRSFVVKYGQNDYYLNFNHLKREELFGKEAIEAYETDGSIIIGENLTARAKGIGPLGTKIYLVMDKNGTLYSGLNGLLTDLTSIEQFLGLDSNKAPIDFAELKVMGINIPIGIIFGYEMGLSNLLKELRVTPRRVNAGTRLNLEDHEYCLVFSDETLVFSKDDKLATIILAGFNEYHKALRNYSVYEFDKRAVYLNVIESGGASVRYIREIDLLYRMFIDPITHDLLVEMKEPLEFHGLLKRCCELLLTDDHPHELDPSYMRIKGYERMAGAVYSELVKSIRSHNGRPGKSKHQIDLNPYAVWKNISQDPSIAIVSDINPIENLKEIEAVTYGGVGGRSSRSMTKRTRIYHKNDMGTISEATVDSGDVAINTYTSADPQFTSLRGISKRYEIGKTGATALLSSSALLAPCTDRDD